MSWFYYTGRVIARCLLFLLARWEVTGAENIPAHGPVIVVANHVSNADPPLVGVCSSRKMMFMAKEELFRNPVTGYFIRAFGAFPVHRSRFDRKALRKALETLENGTVLVMFPEGARSPDGKLQAGLSGAALVAAMSGAVVVPVGIVGTGQFAKPLQLLRRPRVTVNIGEPFHLPVSSAPTKEELAGGTKLIMTRIAALLPPERRGVYG